MEFLSSFYKNSTAIITENNEYISYQKLYEYVDKFSNIIKKRYLVFLVCKNNLESIVGYLSFIKSDCVISLIDEKIPEKYFNKLIKDYRPEYIFFEKNRIKKLDNFTSIYNFYSYELLKSKKITKKKIHDDLSLLISTSGTTGTSKFVRQSKVNIQNNTKVISKYLSIIEKDVAITTLPMSYVYGLSIINTHFYKKSSIVLNTKSLVEKNFWVALQKYKVTNFGGVPYIYSILEKINLDKFDLTNLRYTTQAGGKLNPNTTEKIIQKYRKLNIKLFIMYGAAEATARMSYLPWEKIQSKPLSIGKPITGGKFYIENESLKKIIKPNETGELIYKGKNVFMGYAKNFNDLSKGDINKGVLRTGDIAYKDKDNYYYIVGRKDRYIKMYGMRVNLQELEEIILDYGVENMCIEEKINKILIYVKNYYKLENLKKYIINLTNLHSSSIQIKKIKEFPLNQNLKISYNKKFIK